MYIKLQIFTDIGTLKILEQKDTPRRETITISNGVTIKSVFGPDIYHYNRNYIIFYLRGSEHSRDLTVLNYYGEETLHRILKALATIATVDIKWS